MLPKTSTHHNIQVRCTMDQPIQLLIDKLSTKSADLYVFWQNYNEMYRQYNEKVTENTKLKQQIQQLKRTLSQPKQPQVRMVQDPYLKDRLRALQSNSQILKTEIDKQKGFNNELKIQNTRLIQEINQMQILIAQMREQNLQQKTGILNILQKLKNAQNEITQYAKLFEQVQQKDAIINKLLQKQKSFQILIEEKDDQIEQLMKACQDTKNKYERIIKQSNQRAKQAVMNSISPNYKLTS